jgi:hypothetical protein
MPAAIDTANVTSNPGTNVTSNSFSVTVGAGDNALFIQESALSGSGAYAPSGITYNGVSLTMVPSSSIVSTDIETSLWYLVNPPTGSHTLVVTYGSYAQNVAAGALPMSGVNTASPIGTAATAGSSSSLNVAVTVTGGTANDLYIGVCGCTGTAISSGSAPQVNQWQQQNIDALSSASGDSIPGNDTGSFSWTGSSPDFLGSMNAASAVAVKGAVTAAYAPNIGFNPGPGICNPLHPR